MGILFLEIFEERIAQELYGDRIISLVKNKIQKENPTFDSKKIDEVFQQELIKVVKLGYDEVFRLNQGRIIRNFR